MRQPVPPRPSAVIRRNVGRAHVPRLTLFCLLVSGSLAAAPSAFEQEPAARVVCDRLLPAAALAADAGSGFVLRSFDEPEPDHWQCAWETGGQTPRRLTVQHVLVGTNRVRDMFMDRLGKLTAADLPMENIYDVGSVGVLATMGDSLLMTARNDEAILVVSSTGLTSSQMMAVSRRIAGTPGKTIADARAALARLRGQPVMPFEPLPALPDIVVRRDGKPLECERMLPRAEVVAVLGAAYRLTDANDPRPGFSFCEWKRPADDYPFALRVHAEPEFAGAKVKGPEGFFAFEVGLSPCSQSPGQPLQGIGVEALLCSSGDQYLNVIIRRATDVLVLSCFTCRREDMIALASAAVK